MLAAAEAIEDAQTKASTLARMVQFLDQAGEVDRALAVAQAIEDAQFKASAMAEIAQSLAWSGEPERAVEVAEQVLAAAEAIEDAQAKASAMARMAQVLAQAGEVDRALAVAQAIEDAQSQASALASVAQALAQAGEKQRAVETAEQALAAAEAIRDSWSRDPALASTARALVQAGEFDRVLEVAEGIKHAWSKDPVLREMVEAQIQTGDYDRALVAAKAIEGRLDRADAFSGLAPHLPEEALVAALFDPALGVRRTVLYELYKRTATDEDLNGRLRQAFAVPESDLAPVRDLTAHVQVRAEVREWLKPLLVSLEEEEPVEAVVEVPPEEEPVEAVVEVPPEEEEPAEAVVELPPEEEPVEAVVEAPPEEEEPAEAVVELPPEEEEPAEAVVEAPPEEETVLKMAKPTPAAFLKEPYVERGADRTTVVVRNMVFQSLVQGVDREQDLHTLDVLITPSVTTREAEQTRREKTEERREEEAEERGGEKPDKDWRYHVLLRWLEESDGRPQEHYFEGPLRLDVGNEPLGRMYGAALFDALFHEKDPEKRDRLLKGEPGRQTLLTGYRRAVERSRDEEGLHIQLRIDTQAEELHGYTWEYLWDPEDPKGGSVACNEHTPFARVLHVSSKGDRRPTISHDEPLRILAAMASPADLGHPEAKEPDVRDLPPLDRTDITALPGGLDHVGGQVEPLVEGDNLLLSPDHCVSLEALRRRLQEAQDAEQPFHVLHLLCHGLIRSRDRKSCLVLHAHDSEQAEVVPEDEFAASIGEFAPDLRLVVLASCSTARPAQGRPLQGVGRRLVAAGVPAVIAMQDEFRLNAAQHFCQRLYVQLAHHGVVDRAVNAARHELLAKARRKGDPRKGRVKPRQWAVPVLFMRIPDGRLFDLKEGAADLSDPKAQTQALPYEDLPGSDPARQTEGMLRTLAAQMGVSLNLAVPTLTQTLREALEAARVTPAPPAEERRRVFGWEGQEQDRWALVQAAAKHRRHLARRSVLFLRGLACAKIARLVEQERLEELDPATFREQIWSGGYTSLGRRNARDVVEGGPRGKYLSTGRAPIEANSTKWRTHHRGFESDDGAEIRDRDRVEITGNLTWADRWKGTRRASLPEGQKPGAGDLKRLLYGRGDTFKDFQELTGDKNGPLAGLDERTASLLLHAVYPDRYMPYHGDLARIVLRLLRLHGDPRYAAGFEGYCNLAADLLADDDLGFEDLADVGYFLQRLAEEDEDKIVLKEARDYPPGLRVKLEETVKLKHSEVDTGLVIRQGVLEQVAAALNARQHVILIGPPGTGKTTLAEDLCRHAHDRDCNRGHVLVTATADWTTFDTIGGYMPESGAQLVFRPGIFLEAIEAQKWLVIDEINRADIDKAFGELFTVLSGQAVTLPYKENGRPVRILPPGHATSRETRDYVMHPSWRIIGTMNVYDKASLFAMSYAFMRRFAFVDVAVPANAAYQQLIRHFLESGRLPFHEHRVPQDLYKLFSRDDENYLMRWRALGPAIALDVVRYLHHRAGGQEENPTREQLAKALTRGHLAEALLLYVVPQFDGLEQDAILKIHGQLKDFFPKKELPNEHWALLERIQELFPFIPDEEWQKTGEEEEKD